ncbi:MAG: DUF3404 domain-containing protein [Bdellovibrionales bacterium]|nr:DUF3404 domain-containing protein [Bdellovibrionales bacterium]
MRSALVLILGILLSAFLAGTLALSPRLGRKPPVEESSILRLKNGFVGNHPPAAVVNLADLGSREQRAELADPALLFPRSTKLPFRELAALYRYANGCATRDLVPTRNEELKKAFRWHAFLCGAKPAPGPEFFRRPPYFHPSGSTYVHLAWKSERPEFHTEAWARANRAYAHVLERADLPSGVLSESERLLADLRPSALKALLDEAGVAISPPSILFKQEGREFAGKYAVYPLVEFQRALRTSNVTLAMTEDESQCLLKDGNSCWNADTERAAREARRPTLFWAGLTLLLSLAAAALLLRNLRRDREGDRRKRFALSALTHELRTPVASLVLHADELRRDFDRLGADSQRALLALVDETQRLLRLTRATAQYLPAITGDKVSLHPERIPVLREFVAEIVAEEAPGARFESASDAAARVDPYWLAVALRNLLRNAVKHGSAPIVVELVCSGTRAEVRVSDGGAALATPLAELVTPGKKPGDRSGLGLGLYVVHEVAREMGGKLRLTHRPTTFVFEFPTEAGV